jgi:hypothetical protein
LSAPIPAPSQVDLLRLGLLLGLIVVVLVAGAIDPADHVGEELLKVPSEEKPTAKPERTWVSHRESR